MYPYNKDEGCFLLESPFPSPGEPEAKRLLEKGQKVSIRAKSTQHLYTWHTDGSCVCEVMNYGHKIVWWAYPGASKLMNPEGQSTYTRIYSDGSLETRDSWGRLYNWNKSDSMMIHGEVLTYNEQTNDQKADASNTSKKSLWNVCKTCNRQLKPYISIGDYEKYGRGYDSYYGDNPDYCHCDEDEENEYWRDYWCQSGHGLDN
jgi:hypothetical protein